MREAEQKEMEKIKSIRKCEQYDISLRKCFLIIFSEEKEKIVRNIGKGEKKRFYKVCSTKEKGISCRRKNIFGKTII